MMPSWPTGFLQIYSHPNFREIVSEIHFVLVTLPQTHAHQKPSRTQFLRNRSCFVRLPDENKTIGIILCKDKSQTLVEITLPLDNDQIFASKYQTVLPDKQAFINLLNENEL